VFFVRDGLRNFSPGMFMSHKRRCFSAEAGLMGLKIHDGCFLPSSFVGEMGAKKKR
jgi:hypothetical protein